MTPEPDPMGPAIRRVRLGTLKIFEITEAELEALERGSPESLFLNLGIATLSVSSSFFIALLTTSIESIRTFCVFVIVTVLGLIGGVTYMSLWWRSRRTLRNVAREIRKREPAEGLQANDAIEE